MNVNHYDMMQDADQHPVLVCERIIHYEKVDRLDTPEKVAAMLVDLYQADSRPEENLYMVALNANMEVLGVFVVSRGNLLETIVDNRAIFTRAMLCGAAGIIIGHNHPSGNLAPSKEDISVCSKVKKAGELMNIGLWDFLILGKSGKVTSMKRLKNV